MLIDADVVAVSPASVWRVLGDAGRMRKAAPPGSTKKGTGFEQPFAVHEHWHIDIAHINIHGTFYYLQKVLLARLLEARPRVISDNGPQFVAKEFKNFIRISGMTHVRTSPYYPQSNGKIERWNGTIKSECIRPGVPLSLDDAKRLIEQYVAVYNEKRLHSGIGYVTPKDMMDGKRAEIHAARDRKLEQAREQRELAERPELAVRSKLLLSSQNAAA